MGLIPLSFPSLALLCFSLYHGFSVLNTDELLFFLGFFRLTFPRGHFPRLAECAHFHYETVDFGNVQVSPENTRTVILAAESYSVW